jgi:hypothetical protein
MQSSDLAILDAYRPQISEQITEKNTIFVGFLIIQRYYSI